VQQTTELSFLQTSSKCLLSVRVYENIDSMYAGKEKGNVEELRVLCPSHVLASWRAATARPAARPWVHRASGDSAPCVLWQRSSRRAACHSIVPAAALWAGRQAGSLGGWGVVGRSRKSGVTVAAARE